MKRQHFPRLTMTAIVVSLFSILAYLSVELYSIKHPSSPISNSVVVRAQTTKGRKDGYCETGNKRVNVAGSQSTTTVQQSYPSCTVTVYLPGTLTLASICSDRLGPVCTPKANPFTSNSDGYYFFYADNGYYDIQFSGGTSPNTIPTPFTRGDQIVGSGSNPTPTPFTAYQTVTNFGTAVTQRTILNLPLFGGLAAVDESNSSRTNLSTSGVKTGVSNVVTDYHCNGIGDAGTGTINNGSTSLSFTVPGGYDTSYYFNIGEGVLIAGAGPAGADLLTTVNDINRINATTETLTLANAASTNVVGTRVQHDNSVCLQSAVNNKQHTIYLPGGRYLVTNSIQLPSGTEGDTYGIEGAGISETFIHFQGLGSAFIGPDAQTDNVFFRDFSISTSTPGSFSTVRPDVSRGSAFDYSKTDVANNVRWSNLRINGWGRWGIFAGNCQGCSITGINFRANAQGHLGFVGPETVQQSGAHEPNVNGVYSSQFDLMPPYTSSTDLGLVGLSINNNSYILTAGVSVFTSDHVGGLIRVFGAGVSGGDIIGLIKSVDSGTQVTLSAKNQTGGNLSGLTGTIYKRNLTSIYLHRANRNDLVNITIQGNVSSSFQAVDAIRVENTSATNFRGVWIEDTGGSAGFDWDIINSNEIGVSGYHTNASGTAATGNCHGGNFKLTTSKDLSITEMDAKNATQHFNLDSTSTVKIDNSILSDPTNVVNAASQNRDRLLIGDSVRYFTEQSGPSYRGTQRLFDAEYGEQYLVNGNFADGAGGMTGWTDSQPTYHSLTNAGDSHYQRYQTINTTGIVDGAEAVVFQQTLTIPDTFGGDPWTLGFDYRPVSFAVTAVVNRLVRVAITPIASAGVGYTSGWIVRADNPSQLATGIWQRFQMSFYPANGVAGRQFLIQVLATTGPNTPVVDFANFRTQPGKHSSWSNDQPITELNGGTIRTTAGLKFRGTNSAQVNTLTIKGPATIASSINWTLPNTLPGSTQCITVTNTGVLGYGACSGGGGGGSPGGADTQLQYNNAGSFGGITGATTNGTTTTFAIDNVIMSGILGTLSNRVLLLQDSGTAVNFFTIGNAPTGGSPTIGVTSSADANTNITYQTKGTGTHIFSNGGIRGNSSARTGIQPVPYLKIITPADTNITASTEAIGINLGGSSANPPVSVTRQWATGTLNTQREVYVSSPTYGFVGASTCTVCATFAIQGAPIAGTNATFTTSYAFWVQGGLSEFDGPVFHNTYIDLARIAAPANPAAGGLRIFANNATAKLACLDNTGADCMPGNVTGTGANTQLTYWTGTSTISGEADLTYDTSNNNITIKNATGGVGGVTVNTTSGGAADTRSIFSSGFTYMYDISNTATDSSDLLFVRGRTASAFPTTNDVMGSVQWYGYNGTNTSFGAEFRGVATQTHTASAAGTKIELYTSANGSIVPTLRWQWDNLGNAVIGTAALSTSATDGFLYIPSSAGTPVGTPTTFTGRVPIEVDTTNSKFYGFFGGSWVNLSGSGGGGTTINPTNNVVPYRSNATTFLDSSFTITTTTLEASQAATARTASAPTFFMRFVTPADTNLTASTESVGIQFGGKTTAAPETRQFATGALTTQRENLFVNPTYSFVSSSTLTNAATVAIKDAPAAGTNATITNAYALWVQAGLSRLDGNLITPQIQDSNNKAELIFTATASAVNQFTMTNAATGGNPSLTVTGTDTNIGFIVGAKGTGFGRIRRGSTTTASASNEIALFSDGVPTSSGQILIGYQEFAGNQFPQIWFGSNAGSPSGSNYSFGYITGTNQTALNASSGVLLRVNNANTPNALAATANGVGINTLNDGTNSTAQLEVASGSASRVTFTATSLANTTVDLAQFSLNADDTSTVANLATFVTNSNGTAATGFGQSFTYQLESSTTNSQNAALWRVDWTDATHPTRTSEMVWQLVNGAAALADVFTIRPVDIYLGPVTSASPADRSFNGPGASGTNNLGGYMYLAGGKSTGNAEPGQVVIKYPLTVASGTTLQNLNTDLFAVPSTMFTQTATATIANTTTETTLFGNGVGAKTIEGGFLRIGRTIRVTVRGIISNTATPTMRFRFKVGGTVLDSGAVTMTTITGTNARFKAQFEFTVRTVGGSGTIFTQGEVQAVDNTGGTGAFGASLNWQMSNTATNTVDTTNSLTLDVTAQWGTANVSNTISATNVIIEILN